MFTEWWLGMLKMKWIQCNYVLLDDGRKTNRPTNAHVYRMTAVSTTKYSDFGHNTRELRKAIIKP